MPGAFLGTWDLSFPELPTFWSVFPFCWRFDEYSCGNSIRVRQGLHPRLHVSPTLCVALDLLWTFFYLLLQILADIRVEIPFGYVKINYHAFWCLLRLVWLLWGPRLRVAVWTEVALWCILSTSGSFHFRCTRILRLIHFCVILWLSLEGCWLESCPVCFERF